MTRELVLDLSFLKNKSLLGLSDVTSFSNFYGWNMAGVGAFNGANYKGGADLLQGNAVSGISNHLGTSNVFCNLNGTSDFYYSNSSEFDDTGSFSIGAMIKPTSLPDDKAFFGKWNTTPADQSFRFYTNGGALFFQVYYASGSTESFSVSDQNDVLTDGNWHHFFVVFNTSTKTITIYIDGKIVGHYYHANLGTRNNGSGSDLTFGALDSTTPLKYYTGGMTEMAYYKGALDFDDVRRLFVQGSSKLAYLENSKVRIMGETGPLGRYNIRPTNGFSGATGAWQNVTNYFMYAPVRGLYRLPASICIQPNYTGMGMPVRWARGDGVTVSDAIGIPAIFRQGNSDTGNVVNVDLNPTATIDAGQKLNIQIKLGNGGGAALVNYDADQDGQGSTYESVFGWELLEY